MERRKGLGVLMETYQPIFDAVRSALSNCDVGQAIESAIRDLSLSHHAEMAAEAARCAAAEHERPCVLFHPKLSLDGNQRCALYGENIQDGVAGFGDSPAHAMREFDKEWLQSLSSEVV